MDIIEFLEARLNEMEAALYNPDSLWYRMEWLAKDIELKRDIIHIQKQWPVLVRREAPMKLDRIELMDQDTISYQIMEQIQWLTMEEYLKVFGDEPPTTPILLKMAKMYDTHPDFQEEWRDD